MKFTSNFIVLGAKKFKDTVDGVAYDQTKLIVMMDMKTSDSDRIASHGFVSEEAPFLTSAEYQKHKLSEVPYPHVAQCEAELTNKGLTIHGYKFVKKLEIPA